MTKARICDHCGLVEALPESLYKTLEPTDHFVYVRILNYDGEFCSPACAQRWLSGIAEKMTKEEQLSFSTWYKKIFKPRMLKHNNYKT